MIVNPMLYSGKKLPELDNPGTAADLLAGKQLVDQYGNPLTGTMPQKSASDLTASGASIIVPAGYYPSQISKSVATATHPKPTLSRSGGTVTATHVQSAGYTSGGTTTETLTIPTQAGKTVTPTTYAQTAVASGRLTTGAVNVAGDANLVAGNIKSGVSIFGVAGAYKGKEIQQQTLSGATVSVTSSTSMTFNFNSLTNTPSEILYALAQLSNVTLDDGNTARFAVAIFSSNIMKYEDYVGNIFGKIYAPQMYNGAASLASVGMLSVNQNQKQFSITTNSGFIRACTGGIVDCAVVYI